MDLFSGMSDHELLKVARKFIDLGQGAMDARSVREPPKIDPNEDETGYYHRDISQGSAQHRKLGEFLQDVAIAENPGQRTPERLLRASGLHEGIGSAGGFLVDADLNNALLKAMFATGKLAQYCFKVKISKNANSVKLNAFNEVSRANAYRLGGIETKWTAEAGTKAATKPDLRQMELVLKKLTGLCYASDELLQDAEFLGQVLMAGFASEMGFKVDDAILNGTGAGQPLGILNSPALVTISKETGQPSATIQNENLLKMFAHQINPSGAIWLINKNIIPQLYGMGIMVGLGGSPIFLPAGNISGQPFNTILGRPVIEVEQCQTLGTKGDIYFVDLGQYIWADKGGIQSASSIHVKFSTDETTYRWVYRCDGQPVLASAVTPYKGSDDVSYYVTLEDRS